MKTVIKRKVLISMLFLGLSMLGVVSYKQLPLELMPNVESSYLIVQVGGPREMDPSYIEKQGVIPVEGAVGTLDGVSSIETSISRGSGRISVYFKPNVDIDYAFLQLQAIINQISTTLPSGFSVRISKTETERQTNTFMRLQVRGSGGLERVRSVIDNYILEELGNIEGISNVTVTGGQVKAVEIILNDDAVKAYNITPSRIASLIRQNTERKSFVGNAYEKAIHYFVNVVSDYVKINNLQDIVINPNGPVLLRDVADIVFGTKEQESISRVNGKDAVTMQMSRDARANIIELSHTTRSVIDRLNARLAYQDVEIVIQSDAAEEIESNINLLMWLALTGGFLAVIILWFFLRNIRLVAAVTLSIPISVFISFNLFYAFGITLNSLTLVGMVLAIGMLVDSSVVVLENIYRHLSLGCNKDAAVVKGTTEVKRSIVASTLTTIAVLFPFAFSSNEMVKLIGRNVGISIISTLMVSLFVALLLIPVLTHSMISRAEKKSRSFERIPRSNRVLQLYILTLKSAIRYPAATIIIAVILFFISVGLCLKLNRDVPQEVQANQFTLYVTMPGGSTLEVASDIDNQLESKFSDIEEINERISQIYAEEATITVTLKDKFEKINGWSVTDIKELIEKRIEGFTEADVSLSEASASSRFNAGTSRNTVASFERLFGIGQQQERILVKGNDYTLLQEVADNIEYNLNELESINSVSVNVSRSQPEIHLLFDKDFMNQNDIALNTISSELASFQRETSAEVTYKQGEEQYDITIHSQTVENKDKTIDDLRELAVTSQTNAVVSLDQFSKIVYAYGISSINRIDQQKRVEVRYSFTSDVNNSKPLLEAARSEVVTLIGSLYLPPDVAVEIVSDKSEIEAFYFLIAASFILIFMILASVFQSLSKPFVMMFTIPLATIGSFWALIFTGNSLMNANSLIGFLILLGIVVNNGIILIDYANILQRKGFRRSRAILTASKARIRPILITAITTIVAVVPLAMGRAEYVSRIGAPFAITVIGGLTAGTLFTLIFIPAVFSGLENVLAWFQNLSTKLRIIQISAFGIAIVFIYFKGDSFLWKLGYLALAVAVIPALTWFITTSLRRAHAYESYFEKGTLLRLNIQRVVKIYDELGRFIREWNKGNRIEQHCDLRSYRFTRKDFGHYTWQIPLLGFLIYFIYFYVESQTWLFILSLLMYGYLYSMLKPIIKFCAVRYAQSQNRKWNVIKAAVTLALIWGFPAASLGIFHTYFFETRIILFIGIAWYGSLAYTTISRALRKKAAEYKQVSGRFAQMKQALLLFVRTLFFARMKNAPFKALSPVSLQIENGMFGLLGPNGAGKTTLMRILCGILDMSRGAASINDIDLTEKREELQGLIGFLPQEFGFYENMTAGEFLDYMALLKGIYDFEKRESAVKNSLKSVHLDEYRNWKIKTFSGGMKQRLGIATTLLHLPKILVVDEPTAGLDPRERIRFRNLLVELSRERIVIFSTHIIEDISSSCNQVAVLNEGELYFTGEPQKMTAAANGKVWQFFTDLDTFEHLQNTLWIVHHMRVNDKIRIRCLSEESPTPDAVQVEPTMEDAYLWLLGKNQTPNIEMISENEHQTVG